MASKNLKTIHIRQLGFIQKFIENVREKTGEEVEVRKTYSKVDGKFKVTNKLVLT